MAGRGIGDNFLEHSLKQTNVFARRIVFQTLFATIKQNVYSIGTYSAPEATQILVKCIEKRQKFTFLKVYHFSIHQNFPDTKTFVVRATAVEYISQKRG